MSTTNQLHTFLDQCAHQFQQYVKNGLPEKKIVHFTLGNEAADLDSMVCAIGWAFLLQHLEKDNLVVPLINIPPEDFALRTDVTWFFGELGLNRDHLVFLTPEIYKWILSAQKHQTQFTLVDHNR